MPKGDQPASDEGHRDEHDEDDEQHGDLEFAKRRSATLGGMATNGKKPNQTLVLLGQIRDEAKKTNVRVDRLTDEIHELRGEIKEIRDYIPQVEMRLATVLTDAMGPMRELRDSLRDMKDGKLAEHEKRIAALERKSG